ncbi:MAG: 30S ribosomal protein S1 [Flavobacteriales bacterium]|nr:30S ribosomal protein S1 [Flavobacteriales bacterium]MCX7650836.1 30S ribosomal protein S1 [Flavobacteriales bacterium]MDW8431521.1 30S ribosomal protein S1 [Flavobacteriales bacterium]
MSENQNENPSTAQLVSEQADLRGETPVPATPSSAYVRKTLADYGDEGISDGSFDWSALEGYTEKEKEVQQEFYTSAIRTINQHEIVTGTVVAITPKDVVININYKSEGVVPRTEFRYNPDLKVGDEVEVYVDELESKNGLLVLSHKNARLLRAWDKVNEMHEADAVVTGYVKCRTKGGLIVDLFGLEAFLPGSQIDVKPIKDYDVYVGKNMEFKIVKINPEFRNVVVSHKVLLEEELEQQKKDIISKLEKGQVLEGVVKGIQSYGVFVDLGGVDGLIHITDLSWGRISHPEEVVQMDQKINVVVLEFDDEKKRIALGYKQLQPHPWDQLDPNLKAGDRIRGKVVMITDYGAFVEIAPGVEGLVHVSEMSYSQHVKSAKDFVKEGEEIEVMVLSIDKEERKISLGIKQLHEDPWTRVPEKYAVGTRHTATVKNFTNYGIFVELEEGVDGLIHISDLSWTKKIKHPSEVTKINDQIEVVVLEIDTEHRRLSLGHKQLEPDPWETFSTIFEVGSVHEGVVLEKVDKGYLIALPYGIEGFAPTKHLKKEDGSTLKIDDRVPFKVVEFNKGEKKILVSHTKVWEEEKEKKTESKRKREVKDTAKAIEKVRKSLEKTTLGDLEALSNLKEAMEKSRKTAAKSKKKEEAPSTAPESPEASGEQGQDNASENIKE